MKQILDKWLIPKKDAFCTNYNANHAQTVLFAVDHSFSLSKEFDLKPLATLEKNMYA